MNDNLVSAVFDNHSEAEAAARDLRAAGVPDSALSVIARRQEGGIKQVQNSKPKTEMGDGPSQNCIAGFGQGQAFQESVRSSTAECQEVVVPVASDLVAQAEKQ